MHKQFLKKYYFIDKFEKSNIDKQDSKTTIIYRNYKKNYEISEIIFINNILSKYKVCFKAWFVLRDYQNFLVCINLIFSKEVLNQAANITFFICLIQ